MTVTQVVSEQGGTDYITFDIGPGTPQIVVSTLLPAITDKLNINGNTGDVDASRIARPCGGRRPVHRADGLG